MSNYNWLGRDSRGRWLKGYCPNPKGRPRKQPKISDADVGYFKQQIVEVTINGKKQELTRHELLMHSLFDVAIKGKSVTVAQKLFDRFEESDKYQAEARELIRKETKELLEAYYETGDFDLERGEDLLRLIELSRYGSPSAKERKPRRKPKASYANWRRRPKPQSLLDLEAQEEAEILRQERSITFDPEADDEGGEGA